MTTYEEIYERFLSKIEDYDIYSKLEMDVELVKSIMFSYLRAAISKFTYCVNDLSKRNDEFEEFELTLTEMEKEIIVLLMIVEYMSPKIYRNDLLEERLGSKDFKEYSPASFLKELKELRQTTESEARSLMAEYHYRGGV